MVEFELKNVYGSFSIVEIEISEKQESKSCVKEHVWETNFIFGLFPVYFHWFHLHNPRVRHVSNCARDHIKANISLVPVHTKIKPEHEKKENDWMEMIWFIYADNFMQNIGINHIRKNAKRKVCHCGNCIIIIRVWLIGKLCIMKHRNVII